VVTGAWSSTPTEAAATLKEVERMLFTRLSDYNTLHHHHHHHHHDWHTCMSQQDGGWSDPGSDVAEHH
jgi:hypothetical protein